MYVRLVKKKHLGALFVIIVVLSTVGVYGYLSQVDDPPDLNKEYVDQDADEVVEQREAGTNLSTSNTDSQEVDCGGVYQTPDELEALPRENTGPEPDRYVNKYSYLEEPVWLPENEIDLDNPKAGAYEVTRYPETKPNRSQLEEAWRLYNESYDAAVENGWFNFENAVEDGYKAIDPPHYINVERSFDGRDLDPQKPEQLVYYPNPNEDDSMVLAGFMYTTQGEGEQVGGPLTLWHYHPVLDPDGSQLLRDMIDASDEVDRSDAEKALRLETEQSRTVEMIHVWFIEYPEGPFATSMAPPDDCLEKPEKFDREEFENYTLAKYDEYFR